jgi:hypothetical protein
VPTIVHRLSPRLAAAVESAFAHLRDEAMNSAKRTPIEHLACYRIAISNMNFKEGREPSRVMQ